MSMYSEDYEYANSRLIETIVRKGKEPIFVYNVGPGMKVEYVPLGDKAAEGTSFCHIDELDLKPVTLGFCNYNKYATYLARMPMRRDWRQGLRRGNFAGFGPMDPQRIPYESLKQVIIGDYPTFDACLKALKTVKSIAWHRHWAMTNYGDILYKSKAYPVGKLENNEVKLDESFAYLSEALKESL